ncbi:MAG: Glu/Leu/Phe/Val dehydrogenase [Alphaproteobacteria bacterium]|nr:Glu/Leu/Phe/Val dehydrogenase [Alphaproteobacteria bacterium]MDE1987945.1 Glu/Leu/Phe/Val dehydrogenase [Alphaproteobacteria bacterium]MDE2163051.1 Glu/Leu/Phe/Val dehydrogenase [Alphaproteobacteria bacterium]MDE2267388.1 Glu/Leu/Phe/Val dehydrogenase [Alphaproteobacteria bacterium]MDE2500048.1 Glu/Leu/Phe/Val dehydrogenase [Alphaproteobacteria bacterium]
MNVFDSPDFDAHETVSFFNDKKTGLKCIIAIHSTALGPACGGTRVYPYAGVDAAMTDVLRLSRGMTYKNAIADLPLGGGKAVIIGDPAKDKSEAKLLAYAEAVNALGGRYVTAMDVGIKPADMPIIARGTKHIAGYDQPGKTGGDSGPTTALGVFVGLKAAVKHRLKVETTKGLTVAIQGLGKVGMGLAKRLHEEAAKLVVSDINEDLVRRAVDAFGARVASPDDIITAECDVLSPNAMGAILNEETIPRIHARVVAGGANNQLARDEHGGMLAGRGILYAPDYAINGGGIIRVAGQIYGWNDEEIERRTLVIADTLTAIFRRADEERVPTNVIADAMAVERVAAAGSKGKAVQSIF